LTPLGEIPEGPVDLSACDRETVQFPGAVMPHGALLVVAADGLTVTGASANASELLGTRPEDLWAGGLGQLLGPADLNRFRNRLAAVPAETGPVFLGQFGCLPRPQACNAFAHRAAAEIVLELEPVPGEDPATRTTECLADVAAHVARVRDAATWRESMAAAARELKRLTGYDAALAVRFLPDGSAQVIGEARETHLPSYLDKRFPRSDIPEPGRRQMLLMPAQYAPDLAYEPVPIVLADTGRDPRQLDLTRSLLRSISPMCRRFYRNLGNRARFVLSLIQDRELWGYLVCWNTAPRSLAYPNRLAAETFARMAALLLAEKEKSERDHAILAAKRRIGTVIEDLGRSNDLGAALRELPARLGNVFDAAGIALVQDGQAILAGTTPGPDELKPLLHWLDRRPERFHTDRLPQLSGLALADPDAATGLLAARLTGPGEYLLCFRPEWPHEVEWAGNPEKPVEIDLSSGEARFTPRGSFEVWKQDVRGTARPWGAPEREALADLQQALVRLRHVQMLDSLSARLERSNSELEAFAYAASHDLQEPLRSIRNFARFLETAIGSNLADQERGWLDVIVRQSERMSRQIEALLSYARAGKQEPERRPTDLDELVRSVAAPLAARAEAAGAAIDIPRPLPRAVCDPLRIASVFENLVANGLKYNDQAEKRIEIGWLDGAVPTFYVKDNGIGIPGKHHADVFTIFRRLHGRDEYGGGTGAGLTIAHKHVERHGGRMWLESEPGNGSTFFFTLEAQEDSKASTP
jgi:light-regulated signal transduction histidine kinase (bacteriophytochrome)